MAVTPPEHARLADPDHVLEVADAYSRASAGWQSGPGLVYDRLARAVLDRWTPGFAGAFTLDVGAGTGAAGRAALERGARAVVAVDLAFGMLATGSRARPLAAVADARSLPFRARCFDVATAAFVLNHVDDPVRVLRELVQVVRPGGGVVVSSYGGEDVHPVKAAVDDALISAGWRKPAWWERIRDDAMPVTATIERVESVVGRCGLSMTSVELIRVPFDDLGPLELVRWRLGMAQNAGFVARLDDRARQRLEGDALARLGVTPPPLVRTVIVARGTVP